MSGRNEKFGLERVFVGLGGNIGDPRRAMAEAIGKLVASGAIDLVAVSSLYRTPPWGKTDQSDFLNAVIELRCRIGPRELLDLCLDAERSLKRKRSERWGPRNIDLDILAYGARTIVEPGLSIPHPRLAERAFILVPLAEIAPKFEIADKRVDELLAGVDATGIAIDTAGDAWLVDR